MKEHTEQIGRLWCKLMHDDIMWPAHGRYECRTCGRHHQIGWEQSWPIVRLQSRFPEPAASYLAEPARPAATTA